LNEAATIATYSSATCPPAEGHEPLVLLEGRTGYVQADAATVSDRLFNGAVARPIEVAGSRTQGESSSRSWTWTVTWPIR
jgi:hypothetical protein